MQPVEQGCVLLQLPWQAAKLFASARSWRAETVPAQRMAVTNVASNVFLMNFLFMFSLVSNLQDRRSKPRCPSYFAGLNAGGRMHEPVLVPAGILQKQSMLQDICLPQMPPQKGLAAEWFRNWRAESVPAQTTAMTMVANNVDLIIFLPMITPIK